MLRNNTQVIPTLLYSDLFDYPLTEQELEKYQIAIKGVRGKGQGESKKENGFYCLKGREEIIQQRLKRQQLSEKKIILAKKIARRVSVFPTVQLIGLSGSLAMKNARETDDIDFFVITSTGTLWITRLIILVLLSFLGVRRKKFDRYTNNKVCVNMLLDERGLTLPKQNLYTAHEVVQMKPLVIKNNIYQKFLQANVWVKDFLPHAISFVGAIPRNRPLPKNKQEQGEDMVSPLRFFEFFAKAIQIWYMKKYRTKEIITDTLLAFHPVDQGEKVLREFERRMKKIV